MPWLLFNLLLVLCGYYLRAATIRGQCLFLWEPGHIRIRYVRVWWWWLPDTVSSTHRLSVLLSVVWTTHATQAVLALVWWLSSEIIGIRVRVQCLLAAATIWGPCLFCSRVLDCVATIWGQCLFEEKWYTRQSCLLLSCSHPQHNSLLCMSTCTRHPQLSTPLPFTTLLCTQQMA